MRPGTPVLGLGIPARNLMRPVLRQTHFSVGDPFSLQGPGLLKSAEFVKNGAHYFLKIAERVPFGWIRHVLAAFNRLDPESGMNLREKQVYDNFLKAIDEIIQQKPDVLVHAGDLFDVVKPKTRAYLTELETLNRVHSDGPPPPHDKSQPHAR